MEAKALCQVNGTLAVYSVTLKAEMNTWSRHEVFSPVFCPICGDQNFAEFSGWTECSCGNFSILTGDLAQLQSLLLIEMGSR